MHRFVVSHCPLNLWKTKTQLDRPRVAATYRTCTPSAARFLCAYECVAKLGVGILVAALSRERIEGEARPQLH